MSAYTLRVPEHAFTLWLKLHEELLLSGPTPCAGSNRDDWTGTSKQQERAADACWDCPVLSACAAYANAADESHGVWGGRPRGAVTSR